VTDSRDIVHRFCDDCDAPLDAIGCHGRDVRKERNAEWGFVRDNRFYPVRYGAMGWMFFGAFLIGAILTAFLAFLLVDVTLHWGDFK